MQTFCVMQLPYSERQELYTLCTATHFVDSENMLTERVVSQNVKIRQYLVLLYVSYCMG